MALVAPRSGLLQAAWTHLCRLGAQLSSGACRGARLTQKFVKGKVLLRESCLVVSVVQTCFLCVLAVQSLIAWEHALWENDLLIYYYTDTQPPIDFVYMHGMMFLINASFILFPCYCLGYVAYQDGMHSCHLIDAYLMHNLVYFVVTVVTSAILWGVMPEYQENTGRAFTSLCFITLFGLFASWQAYQYRRYMVWKQAIVDELKECTGDEKETTHTN